MCVQNVSMADKKKEVEEYSKVRLFFPPTKECYAPKCWKTVTKVIR